jgi:Heterokaryon incompatibility protein Het-C
VSCHSFSNPTSNCFFFFLSRVGKAFRHGDIENILLELIKSAGHTDGGGGLLGIASSILSSATGGAKFSKDDVKRVYFVNTLSSHYNALY